MTELGALASELGSVCASLGALVVIFVRRGGAVFAALFAWLRSLFGGAPALPPPPPTLAQKVERLRMALAEGLLAVYAGEKGQSAFIDVRDGLMAGQQVGRAVGGATGGSAGPVIEAIGAAAGAIFGAVGALIAKENLRVRFRDFALQMSPVERYLCVALLRPMSDAARERDRLPLLGRWRFVPSGVKTIGGPLSDFPGFFNVESLCEFAWPSPPSDPTQRDRYISYCLAVCAATENDDVRLNHPGSPLPPLTAIWRQQIGGPANNPGANWLHREWEIRGGPTAGQARATATAAGMRDVVDAPLWPELEALVDEALARRAPAR